MVHVQHTAIARGAVVAAFWLENIAHKTVSTTFVLRISKMEAPEDRHLAGISRHSLNERPSHHEEKEMEDTKEPNDLLIVLCLRQPAEEHV